MPGRARSAPVLALGLYANSAELERGGRPALGRCIREEFRRLGDVLVYSLVLLVVGLLWLRAGSGMQAFHPANVQASTAEMLRFLAIGSAVGSVFALLALAASAFALPMLLDRRTDGMTAVVTSERRGAQHAGHAGSALPPGMAVARRWMLRSGRPTRSLDGRSGGCCE